MTMAAMLGETVTGLSDCASLASRLERHESLQTVGGSVWFWKTSCILHWGC